LESFRAARQRGWQCFYDLPIGHWRAGQVIYREEAMRKPEWACTLGGIQDSDAKLARKDAELELADTVIVASSFTRRTLDAAPGPMPSIHVIPYGAPPVVPQLAPAPSGGKLRVLFVGALGQRKGLSYLLSALSQLANVAELTLLGRKTAEACAPLNAAVKVHRWIPSLPHHEVLAEMARHDVLVFPSLFEGFGLVLLEAMSRGLPVITTAHTAGPDFIREGVDGFIVPIRSTAAIVEKLEALAHDRELLAEMKRAARATAERCSWDGYRCRLAELAVRGTSMKTARTACATHLST
jgi:glycosyltransferase involved in cell wall biosynthesis